MRSLLYSTKIPINQYINISIPTVGEIIDNQDEYYSLISILTAMPIDMMAQLDEAGIDFTQINEYELFLMLFSELKKQDTKLVFGDLDLSKFELAANEQDGSIVLIDIERDIKIDRLIHDSIANTLRSIHGIEKDTRMPGNEAAKQFMIKRAKAKLRRKKKQKEQTQLESLIVAMVNAEQYKYDFESTRNLTIYQFNQCVSQIINKVDYDNRMFGVYSGTINAKELKQEDLTWIKTK